MGIAPKCAEYKMQSLKSYAAFLRGEGFPLWPLSIFLDPCSACNMRCLMCNSHSLFKTERIVKERDLLHWEYCERLDSVFAHCLTIRCHGDGEPTLHPHFSNLLRFLEPYEVMLEFCTNGMRLSRELCEVLVQSKVYQVIISFSGTTKEEYESIYRGGSFEKVLGGIQLLSDCKREFNTNYPLVAVNSIAFKHHIRGLVEFVDLMADRGVGTIRLFPFYDTGFPGLAKHKAVYRRKFEGEIIAQAQERARCRGLILFSKHFEHLVSASDSDETGEPVQGCCTNASLKDLEEIVSSLKPKQIKSIPLMPASNPLKLSVDEIIAQFDIREDIYRGNGFLCPELFLGAFISVNGMFTPCCHAPKKNPGFGGLEFASGEEIWNGAPLTTARKLALHGHYPMNYCRACLRDKKANDSYRVLDHISGYNEWFDGCYGSKAVTDEVIEEVRLAEVNKVNMLSKST